MKTRTASKLLTFVALISWLCAGLMGLHSHIHLDGSPATLDSSFFKDALDDAYGHKANPHVDTDSNSTPAKNLNLAILVFAGLMMLLFFRADFSHALPWASPSIPAPTGLRPPLRAPPASAAA